MTSAAATDPHTDNWDKVDFYLQHALSLFGYPAKLAQQLWISLRDYRLFSHYIRPLEQAVRQLIFIAALDLAPTTLPPTPERKFRERRGMPANARANFEPANPETWRASFKLSLRSAGAPARTQASRPNKCRRGAGAPERISSVPSAQRLEALLRAYEQRDKLAAALARKLARNARAAMDYLFRRKQKPGK
jgi:hypothetical protein